jgi:hypothetical protein
VFFNAQLQGYEKLYSRGMASCNQRRALFEKYRLSTNAYADLLKQLRGAIAADYDHISAHVQLARQKMLAAQENLNLHLSRHRCDTPPD